MLSRRELLHSFEWHDLPLDEIAIGTSGVSVLVTPYDELLQGDRRVRLTLTDPVMLQVDITSSELARSLAHMEVSSFDILEESDDYLSGTITVLPGDAGLWQIRFTRARWQLAVLDGVC